MGKNFICRQILTFLIFFKKKFFDVFGGLLNQKLAVHIGKNLWDYSPIGVLLDEKKKKVTFYYGKKFYLPSNFDFFDLKKNFFDFQIFFSFAIAQGVERWKPQAKMLNIEGAIAFWNSKLWRLIKKVAIDNFC